jgi:L-fucose isomerase-like protein
VTSVGQLVRAVHDLETYHLLRRARVGLVGRPSDWLIASSPSPATVRQAWGPEVESISVETLTEEMKTVSSKEARALAEELANSAQQVQEPNCAELEDGARVYLGLRRLVTRYRLSALALRCFDLVVRVGTTGCFALAQLNDEGIIASCEGDVVSMVGMLWAFHLLGQIPWMANPARLNEADNTLWLAHCTVPRCLTRRYRLRSHFESGLGVALQGEMPPGPVTVVRIGGAGLDRIWLAEGELLRSGDAEDLCRTQAEIRLTRGAVSDLLRAPLGNHLVSVQGHHADRLRSWWEAMIGPSE